MDRIGLVDPIQQLQHVFALRNRIGVADRRLIDAIKVVWRTCSWIAITSASSTLFSVVAYWEHPNKVWANSFLMVIWDSVDVSVAMVPTRIPTTHRY